MNNDQYPNKIIGSLVSLIVVMLVVIATAMNDRPSPASGAPIASAAAPSSTVPTKPASRAAPAASAPKVADAVPVVKPKAVASSVYKNGTYTATGQYMSPGGPDQLQVTITLSNDVITSVSVVPEPGDGTSARYQSYFVSGYKQYVIGQNIDSVNLTYVSGSSLTSIGFNDALAQIKAYAKA
ncbi:calcium-binding protein [Patescibacteria group bacterium]|nr:calcium-binding protein [Patescibacteria group bacterium]